MPPFAAVDPFSTLIVLLALMMLGFVVGTLGHIYRSQTTVAIGIALVFMATLLLPLLIYATD